MSRISQAPNRYSERQNDACLDDSRAEASTHRVYCGSADGNHPAYRAEAVALGTAIAAAGLGLVYGGANVGLMGAVADAALEAGGSRRRPS